MFHRSRRIIRVVTAGAAVLTPLVVGVSTAGAADCPDTTYTRRLDGLPALEAELDDLRLLADAMTPAEVTTLTPRGQDPQENRAIPAGYTYFAQFVDHDITSMNTVADDLVTDLSTPLDPASLVNERTTALDLDSLYGRGPGADPQLYAGDGVHLLAGRALSGSPDAAATDLPRDADGTAIVADERNDENRMVGGIHAMFIRLHNDTVDRLAVRHPGWPAARLFETARQQVVTAYQSVIARDLIPRLVGPEVWRNALDARRAAGGTTACTTLPVEFAVAAYRLGHSMVRDDYRLNSGLAALPVFSGTFQPGSDLAGFSPSPDGFAIDWSLFLPGLGANRGDVQWSYKMDAALTSSLSRLPLPPTSIGTAGLALRNLARGVQVGLPSGQDVARALGLQPLSGDRLFVGAATGNPDDVATVAEVAPALAEATPLWTYLLAEAANTSLRVRNGDVVGATPAMRLGPVGSRLVADAFASLLADAPGLARNVRGPVTLSGLFTRGLQGVGV